MDWQAFWIWHAPCANMDNFYLYARKEFALEAAPQNACLFITMDVLHTVDAIDQIRYGICEPDEMRDSLLQLHQMVHHLFSGSLPGGRITHESL